MSKERTGMIAVSMRLPAGLYKRLAAIRKRKPYLSMNAIIIEELSKEIVQKPARREKVTA